MDIDSGAKDSLGRSASQKRPAEAPPDLGSEADNGQSSVHYDGPSGEAGGGAIVMDLDHDSVVKQMRGERHPIEDAMTLSTSPSEEKKSVVKSIDPKQKVDKKSRHMEAPGAHHCT